MKCLEEEQSSKTKPLTIELCPDDTSSQLLITPDGQIPASSSSPVIESTLNCTQHADIRILWLNLQIEHDISLVTKNRIRAKLYPVPFHFQPHFQAEVDKLQERGIIRFSTSPHSSPIVMVSRSRTAPTDDHRIPPAQLSHSL